MSFISRIVFILSILINGVYAKSMLDQIGWHGPTKSVVITLIVVSVAIVAGLIIYHVYSRIQSTQEIRQYSVQLFNDAARRLELTPKEKTMAFRLASYDKVKEPQTIFQSASLFERCVENEIGKVKNSRPNDDDISITNDLIQGIRKKAGFHILPLEQPLGSSRNIAIGQVGAIFGSDHRKPLIEKAHVSESNEFDFTLKYDVDEEDMCYISAGDTVKFAFSRQADSVYGFTLKVVSCDSAGTVVVEHTSEMKRNQLRQYVRIEMSLPMKFRLIQTRNPELSEIKKGVVTPVKMSDISGGGLSFICEKSLKAGDLISVGFTLPNVKLVGIAGKVLRISIQEGKTKTFYKHHVKFVKIEPRQRDGIVKYVFDKQRQLTQWR